MNCWQHTAAGRHRTSEVGEEWLFNVHRLTDGMAIVGARSGGLPANVERRIEADAKRFGGSVAEALRVKERTGSGAWLMLFRTGNGNCLPSLSTVANRSCGDYRDCAKIRRARAALTIR